MWILSHSFQANFLDFLFPQLGFRLRRFLGIVSIPSYCCCLPLCHSRQGGKSGPVLEDCLLFKWELLMSVVSCDVTGLKEWGETHPSHVVSKSVQMTAEQTSP